MSPDHPDMRGARASDIEPNLATPACLVGVSRELRVPLNGILGTLDLLRGSAVNSEQRELIAALESHGNALAHLVNDLLDLARMEAGDLALESIDFDLRGSLESLRTTLAAEAEQEKIALRCAIDPDIPATLRGDPGRLKQAIYDLMLTMIRATRAGEVQLRVALQNASADAVGLDIRAVGNGAVSLPPFLKAGLAGLEPLGKVRGEAHRETPVPLNLVVARRIARMMGGGISLHREAEGQESLRLLVTMSAGQKPAQSNAAVFPGVLRGLKALLVDTHAGSRETLRRFLESWGVVVDEAGSTAAALAKLTLAAANEDPFGLVVLEDGMSGAAGFDLAQQIKERHDLSATTVVLLTSTGVRGDAARCRQIGVSAYLTKPIRASRLLEALALALGPRMTEEPSLITRHTLSEAYGEERPWAGRESPDDMRAWETRNTGGAETGPDEKSDRHAAA